jgi:hypothetical protein
MKPFTKQETLVIGIILLAIVVVSLNNFKIAIRRSRDAQRRGDLAAISEALDKFHEDFGYFPFSSTDNRIAACRPDDFDELLQDSVREEGFDYLHYFSGLVPCQWGKDSLRDLSDESYPAYLASIPADPRTEKGFSYVYLSNGNRYQIYAYLEGEESEAGYYQGVVDRGLSCGSKVCNYGKSFGQTPLEKSIEEYENELREKSQR